MHKLMSRERGPGGRRGRGRSCSAVKASGELQRVPSRCVSRAGLVASAPVSIIRITFNLKP